VGEIKAVFLDRDGTINKDTGHLYRIEDFELLPGSLDALKLFMDSGIKIYIITNQAGIAKGIYREDDFQSLTTAMLAFFKAQGIVIEEVAYCPHHPEGSVAEYARNCLCRKPHTLLAEQILRRVAITPKEAVFVGDKNSDIESGRRLGMRTYLVLTGHGREHEATSEADYVVESLLEAARHITSSKAKRCGGPDRVDAIILAGGLGTRLRGVIGNLPKTLAPIKGKPFLDIILNRLNNYSFIGHVVIAVGYMGDKIRSEYAGSHRYCFEIRFSEEKELLGTGGALKKSIKYATTEDVIALNGDYYVDVDLVDLYRYHCDRAADFTMVVSEVDDMRRFGGVTMDGAGKITGYAEKGGYNEAGPLPGAVNAGVYLFQRRVFDAVPNSVPLSLERELFPGFISKNFYGYVSKGMFIDIGTPESYTIAGCSLEAVQNG